MKTIRSIIFVFAATLAFSLINPSTCQAGVQLKSVSSAGMVARVVQEFRDVDGLYNVYMGALYNGQLYMRDSLNNWRLYVNGAFPIAARTSFVYTFSSLGTFYDFQVTDLDVSPLVGAAIYVAYGTSESDALSNPLHLAKIYTVPPQIQPVHYIDKVYTLMLSPTKGYGPYAVTKASVIKVRNMTTYNDLLNCWLAEKPLTDGRVLVSCQNGIDPYVVVRPLLYIDPTRDELYEYAGIAPADVVWHNAFNNTWAYDATHPTWELKARVSDGWFFTNTTTRAYALYFESDATGAVSVVKQVTIDDLDWSFNLLMSYSNQ